MWPARAAFRGAGCPWGCVRPARGRGGRSAAAASIAALLSSQMGCPSLHTHKGIRARRRDGAGAAFDDVPSIPSRDASLARVPICVDARSREHGSRSRLRGLLQWELSSERCDGELRPWCQSISKYERCYSLLARGADAHGLEGNRGGRGGVDATGTVSGRRYVRPQLRPRRLRRPSPGPRV